MIKKGDKVKCTNNKILKGNEVGPKLTIDKIYEVKEVLLDSKGNPHLDVGIKSKFNYIRSMETREELERGDSIHWCHPSRFTVV